MANYSQKMRRQYIDAYRSLTNTRNLPFFIEEYQNTWGFFGVIEEEEVKMAIVGSEKGSAMERFGSGGMALLPWTKQMLTVLWEQLRLLVQVIYYSFMSGKDKYTTLLSLWSFFWLCFWLQRSLFNCVFIRVRRVRTILRQYFE